MTEKSTDVIATLPPELQRFATRLRDLGADAGAAIQALALIEVSGDPESQRAARIALNIDEGAGRRD